MYVVDRATLKVTAVVDRATLKVAAVVDRATLKVTAVVDRATLKVTAVVDRATLRSRVQTEMTKSAVTSRLRACVCSHRTMNFHVDKDIARIFQIYF